MKQYLVCLVILLCAGNSKAEIISGSPESGNGCGENCSWTLDTDNMELRVYGVGSMNDYHGAENPSPWRSYRKDIKKITISGLEEIGTYAFTGFSAITELSIPDTVKVIKNGAFEDLYNLKNLTLSQNLTTLSSWSFGENSSLNSVIITDKVTSISDTSFIYAQIAEMYCPKKLETNCLQVIENSKSDIVPKLYETDVTGNVYVYGQNGNFVGKYAGFDALKSKTPTETYKYDSVGHLVGIFDSDGKRTWGKKIYTIEEAMEATKYGDKFHVSLTYK